MARPRSEDKAQAILQAALSEFAARGVWATPTSAISRAAGVAEGTLFTYFASKEVLLNSLYCALKAELAEVLLGQLPTQAAPRELFRHFWTQYVRWGAANPERVKVMSQLKVSDQITPESRAAGEAPFAGLMAQLRELQVQGLIRPYPLPFLLALLNSLADTTMAFVATATPGDPVDYCAEGFEVFWRGIAIAPSPSAKKGKA